VLAQCSYSYAVVRVVPRVEREEFVNAGVVLFCEARDFLGARIDLDRARLLAFAPEVDVALVERHLAVVPRICEGGAGAGPIGALSPRERWHWLVAPRSTILQMSPAHGGVCDAPEAEIERLMTRLVELPPRV
jgi:Protein of unknown function (DUF3037)